MILAMPAAGKVSGQAVIVNSPQAIAAGYEFTAAQFGAGLTEGNVWTADAVFVNDGSLVPSESCNPLLNGSELAGKIALIDRGSCEFGLKCLNAQQAGAIAAIVINNAPGDGTFAMGAGVNGSMVTIPSVMIPYEVGQLIRSVILSDQIVNISLGDLEAPPPPANDLVLVTTNTMVAPLGIIPASQIKNAGEFVFTPGARVENRGINMAPNLKLDIVINHTPPGGSPVEVYNQSFNSEDDIETGDTTDLYLFPEFDPFSTGAGIYNYTYTVTMDSVDNASFNNAVSSSFTLSENLYSKATFDPATGNPRIIATTSPTGSTSHEFLTILNIPYGSGYKIDSVIFEVRHAPSLASIPVQAYVYEWNDTDQDSSLTDGELEIKGIAVFTFPEDFNEDGTYLRLPILDFFTFEETGVIIPGDNKDYVIGVRYEGAETSVSFGFDSSNDYTEYINWRVANNAFTDRDYGFLGIQAWDASGLPDIAGGAFTFTDNLGFTSSTGIILASPINDVEAIASPERFEIKLFPNPVKDQLQVSVSFKEKAEYVEYHILDAAGRLLMHHRARDVFETAQASFNVAQLPAGKYHLVVRTSLGIQASSFVVNR